MPVLINTIDRGKRRTRRETAGQVKRGAGYPATKFNEKGTRNRICGRHTKGDKR
jgi:hypothetical protein